MFLRAGASVAECPDCNGDMDGDGVVATADLLLLLSDFDLTDCALLSDANGDCVVCVHTMRSADNVKQWTMRILNVTSTTKVRPGAELTE